MTQEKINIGRKIDIDLLKGFGIILMILGHIHFGSYFAIYCATFFMPLFYVVSGYLFHGRDNTKDFLIKKSKTLLVPYYMFAIFHLLITFASGRNGEKKLINVLLYPTRDEMPIAGALWFLMSLFVCEVLFYMETKYLKKYSFFVNVVWFIILTVIPNLIGIELPFTLETVGAGVLYMSVGIILKHYDKSLNLNIIITVVLIAIHIALCNVNGYVNYRKAVFGNYIIYIVLSLVAIIGYWNLARIIERKCKESKMVSCISYIGRNSIVYLVLNQLIIDVVSKGAAVVNKMIIHRVNSFLGLGEHIVVFFVTMVILYFLAKLVSNTKLKIFIGRF